MRFPPAYLHCKPGKNFNLTDCCTLFLFWNKWRCDFLRVIRSGRNLLLRLIIFIWLWAKIMAARRPALIYWIRPQIMRALAAFWFGRIYARQGLVAAAAGAPIEIALYQIINGSAEQKKLFFNLARTRLKNTDPRVPHGVLN
jgi:hypothetical protein